MHGTIIRSQHTRDYLNKVLKWIIMLWKSLSQTLHDSLIYRYIVTYRIKLFISWQMFSIIPSSCGMINIGILSEGTKEIPRNVLLIYHFLQILNKRWIYAKRNTSDELYLILLNVSQQNNLKNIKYYFENDSMFYF